MKNINQVVIRIYSYNMFDLPIEKVKKRLTKVFNVSLEEINNIIEMLNQKKVIVIKDGMLRKGSLTAKKEFENETKTEKKQKDITNQLVLGTIEQENGIYIFHPKHYSLEKMPLPATKEIANSVGKRVCCRLEKSGTGMIAVVEQIFGEINDPISENISIAYKYGFKKEFSQAVLDEVAQIPQYVTKEDCKNREDMQDLYFMPWDPASCKDKDDAIYAERTDDGYRVYVAIADVSHYVKKGTELDKEAFRRGTSCYLGSGVYPMLPPELSNGICSLNDGAPRLAMVSVIDINKKGKITDYQFKKAVINIKQSFAYEDVEKVWLCQDGYEKTYAKAKPHVDLLYEIADVLERKMNKRGSLTFENREPEFVFNREKNIVEDVEEASNERSHKVVEMLMILANEATSQFFKDNHLQGIYRTHKRPDVMRVKTANAELRKYDVNNLLEQDNKKYQQTLEEIKNFECHDYLNKVVLSTMPRAKYNTKNIGHFGLASEGYTHFTSPIRRYSDTLAHRIISEYLAIKAESHTEGYLETLVNHLNDQEKSASDAEKESDKMLCCMWAEKHLGETFNGFISKVTPKFIVVKRKFVKFIIPTTALKNARGKSFSLDENMHSIVDKSGTVKYSVGDYIDFKISDVDKRDYTIYATNILEKTKEEDKEMEF